MNNPHILWSMESIKEPGDDIATESTEGAINKKVTDTVDHV